MVSFLVFLKVVSIAFAILYGMKLLQIVSSLMKYKQLYEDLNYRDSIATEELINDAIVFGFTFTLLVAISVTLIVIA